LCLKIKVEDSGFCAWLRDEKQLSSYGFPFTYGYEEILRKEYSEYVTRVESAKLDEEIIRQIKNWPCHLTIGCYGISQDPDSSEFCKQYQKLKQEGIFNQEGYQIFSSDSNNLIYTIHPQAIYTSQLIDLIGTETAVSKPYDDDLLVIDFTTSNIGEKILTSNPSELELEYEEREDNYNVAKDLPENPTPLEEIKFEICQKILSFKFRNHLTTEEIARKIKTTKYETQKLLFCWIDNFDLETLVNYASELFSPCKAEINFKENRIGGHAKTI
ncbi:4602_t:CDS:2, partial [Racocetra fulgida]